VEEDGCGHLGDAREGGDGSLFPQHDRALVGLWELQEIEGLMPVPLLHYRINIWPRGLVFCQFEIGDGSGETHKLEGDWQSDSSRFHFTLGQNAGMLEYEVRGRRIRFLGLPPFEIAPLPSVWLHAVE